MLLSDQDLLSYALDDELAVLSVKGQKFIVDYSTLIDFVWNLARVATQLEKASCNESSLTQLQ